ncbi:uncharacterized protein EV422DRAFT_568516 [Fimicolochytrium jonesii]|uniref:uncharacterized protein n=1 Tax=Fimicolochytrium jonesii TaxID=1396493 RepID=UPI0022FE6F8B|nr:uncharacterized protein EV422DRAFT_568516 [Fimicolochytrium jonesii]KAI8819545.1 hypothetical protein EV422DRAFT_568516 [Fimicolochytrium jonesii]
MGLAGPRNKQRIGLDPQNKGWKDDKNKFGHKMMEKMGWTEGKGLGANEDGHTDHVKVRLKENNLGIGADRRTVDNWLDNNSAFDALLKGLNDGAEETTEVAEVRKVEETEVEEQPRTTVAHGRLYHRKKFLRNKLVSNYDAKDLSMILGVKPTETASPSTAVSETTTTSVTAANSGYNTPLQADPLLSVAGKTVHDYFAQKMAAMGLSNLTAGTAAQPVSRVEEDLDDYDAPPVLGGLGLGASENTTMTTTTLLTSSQGLSAFVKKVDVSFTETLLKSSTEGGESEKRAEKKAKKERKEKKRKDRDETSSPEVEEAEPSPRKKKANKQKKDKSGKKSSATTEEERASPSPSLADTSSVVSESKKDKKKREKKEKKERKEKRVEASVEGEVEVAIHAPAKKSKKDKKEKKKSSCSTDPSTTTESTAEPAPKQKTKKRKAEAEVVDASGGEQVAKQKKKNKK